MILIIFIAEKNHKQIQCKIVIFLCCSQEHEGIDKFFRLMNGAYDWHLAVFAIKLIPLWLVKFLFRTGVP